MGTVAVSAAFPAQSESTAKDVSVRQNATVKSQRLGRLQKGDAVTLLGYENNFFQIEWDGENAYVSADYVNAEFAVQIDGAAPV